MKCQGGLKRHLKSCSKMVSLVLNHQFAFAEIFWAFLLIAVGHVRRR